MTTGPTIDYEALQQEAMRGVVRAVLAPDRPSPVFPAIIISTFPSTPALRASVLSKRLKEKYPHEMTIVLQHRFWDLIVSDERFEVKLTFDGIPERLVVPFAAIKVFFDPSVRYGLQFEDSELSMRSQSHRLERLRRRSCNAHLRSLATKEAARATQTKVRARASRKRSGGKHLGSAAHSGCVCA